MKTIHLGTEKNESGSALIYVLFLITFVTIVGSLLLTTVTQGQRHIVQNEQALSHFYRVEGALDIAQAELEETIDSITEEEFIHYLDQFYPTSPYRRYTINGESTIIDASIIKESFTESVTDPMTEEEVVKETHIFTLSLFDPQHQYTYRELIFTFTSERDEGPPPGEPPPGEEPDRFCGLFPCPPGYENISNVIRDSPIGYTYLNGEYPLIFRSAGDVTNRPRIPAAGQATPEYIVIPNPLGEVKYLSNVDVNYVAEKGIGIGAKVNTHATGEITLTSTAGFIIVDEAILETNEAAYAAIHLSAASYISARGTRFLAKKDIFLRARDYIDIEGAFFQTEAKVCPRNIEIRGIPAKDSKGIVRVNCS